MKPEPLISAAFAPQLTAAYWFLAIYAADRSLPSALTGLAVSLTFASALQSAALLSYVRRTRTDFYVRQREKRNPVFLISFGFYLAGLLALAVVKAPTLMTWLMTAYVVNTALAALINRYLTKVSIHVWGISGPSVAIFMAYGPFFLILMMVIAILVGYERISAGAHTSSQVTLALLLSLVTTACLFAGLARLNLGFT
ncbi:MAG: hypothetical protein ACP5UI_02505 [Thermoprotei archaeon]|nr:hypothetical protein [TACK group archaeon]